MSAITHRAAVARLKTFEAYLHNLVKAIAEGRRLDALIQMTLAEMAMLISCLETPADPASTDVHYQSARAAAEAVAHDAFERSGGEPPQPQPVTRTEFNSVAAMVGDIANTLGRERVVERLREHSELLASLNLQKLREECHALAAGSDLASRVSALEKRQLAADHAEVARELRARIDKLSPATAMGGVCNER